jgi:hypothetical protein
MTPIETYKLPDERTLEIHADDDPESPREWDNNGIMYCWHSRMKLGDDNQFATPDDFQAWCDENPDEIILRLPLYLYEHSGVTMRAFPFSDQWDSGQVGWIVATRSQLAAGGHDVDSLDIKQVERWLRGEVETYDQYLTGDVYGFIIRPPACACCGAKSDDTEDSCWGFFGSDIEENGIMDHLSNADAEAVRTQL